MAVADPLIYTIIYIILILFFLYPQLKLIPFFLKKKKACFVSQKLLNSPPEV